MQVNKPYLPLASGEFTMQSALAIVGICGIAALVIGVLVGSLPLMTTLVGSAVLSLAYSVDLPLLRWKQNPVAAAACILAVRYKLPSCIPQVGNFESSGLEDTVTLSQSIPCHD